MGSSGKGPTVEVTENKPPKKILRKTSDHVFFGFDLADTGHSKFELTA